MADQGAVKITMTVPGTGVRGNLVSGAGAFSGTQRAAGVMTDDADGVVSGIVQTAGTVLVKLGGSVAAGDSLLSDASGNAIATTDTVPEAIKVIDDDNAATTGIAVYAHTHNGSDGWLEFVSPTNADGTGTLASGGNVYFIADSDAAATDGVAIYFDEDSTNADERFRIVSPSAQDLYVSMANGKIIRLVHSADAATEGIQVYFDEDAVNIYDRLMFVSPTDTDGASTTDSTARDLSSNNYLSRLISLETGVVNELRRAVLV